MLNRSPDPAAFVRPGSERPSTSSGRAGGGSVAGLPHPPVAPGLNPGPSFFSGPVRSGKQPSPRGDVWTGGYAPPLDKNEPIRLKHPRCQTGGPVTSGFLLPGGRCCDREVRAPIGEAIGRCEAFGVSTDQRVAFRRPPSCQRRGGFVRVEECEVVRPFRPSPRSTPARRLGQAAASEKPSRVSRRPRDGATAARPSTRASGVRRTGRSAYTHHCPLLCCPARPCPSTRRRSSWAAFTRLQPTRAAGRRPVAARGPPTTTPARPRPAPTTAGSNRESRSATRPPPQRSGTPAASAPTR